MRPRILHLLPLLCIAFAPATLRAEGGSAADSARAALPDPDSGANLLGRPAPEFRFDRWLVGEPRPVGAFHGKALLIRFWTDDCKYCRATLPAIEELAKRYGPDGLVVLGAYHPHEPMKVHDGEVRRWAKEYGYTGMIAVDASWRTLTHWWLEGHPERNWVSVSFLVDPAGNVCWTHGGGWWFPSDDPLERRMDRDYRAVEARIREVLGVADDAPLAVRAPRPSR